MLKLIFLIWFRICLQEVWDLPAHRDHRDLRDLRGLRGL